MLAAYNATGSGVIGTSGKSQRLVYIYGNVTTAGKLVLRNGTSGSAAATLPIAMATGNVAIQLDKDASGAFRFPLGCYAEFTASLAGDLTFLVE